MAWSVSLKVACRVYITFSWTIHKIIRKNWFDIWIWIELNSRNFTIIYDSRHIIRNIEVTESYVKFKERTVFKYACLPCYVDPRRKCVVARSTTTCWSCWRPLSWQHRSVFPRSIDFFRYLGFQLARNTLFRANIDDLSLIRTVHACVCVHILTNSTIHCLLPVT